MTEVLTKEQIAGLKIQWEENFSGLSNAYKMGIFTVNELREAFLAGEQKPEVVASKVKKPRRMIQI